MEPRTKTLIHFVIVLHMDGIMVKIKYSPFLGGIKPLEAPQGSPFENLCSNCYTFFFFLLSIVGSVAMLSKSLIVNLRVFKVKSQNSCAHL